jgi:hypothetical protein
MLTVLVIRTLSELGGDARLALFHAIGSWQARGLRLTDASIRRRRRFSLPAVHGRCRAGRNSVSPVL